MFGFIRCKKIYGWKFEFFDGFVKLENKNILKCERKGCFFLEKNWNGKEESWRKFGMFLFFGLINLLENLDFYLYVFLYLMELNICGFGD